jgi:hypothetical protein
MVDMLGKFCRFQSALSSDALTYAVRSRELRGEGEALMLPASHAEFVHP